MCHLLPARKRRFLLRYGYLTCRLVKSADSEVMPISIPNCYAYLVILNNFGIMTMRTTKNISISFPPEMLESFQKLAEAENRTMSELVREALRNYEKQKRREFIAEARRRAEDRGIKEEDVVRIVREYRTEQRGNNKAHS